MICNNILVKLINSVAMNFYVPNSFEYIIIINTSEGFDFIEKFEEVRKFIRIRLYDYEHVEKFASVFNREKNGYILEVKDYKEIPYCVAYGSEDNIVARIYFPNAYMFTIYKYNSDNLRNIEDYLKNTEKTYKFEYVESDIDKDFHGFVHELKMAIDISNMEAGYEVFDVEFPIVDDKEEEYEDWDEFIFNELYKMDDNYLYRIFFIIEHWVNDIYLNNFVDFVKENINDILQDSNNNNVYKVFDELLNSEESIYIIPRILFTIDDNDDVVYIQLLDKILKFDTTIYPIFFFVQEYDEYYDKL